MPKIMQPIATQNALIQNQRIAYAIHGSGPPVVLIHGTPSSSLIWRKIYPKVVQSGFKVHFFDLLGYGISERLWDPSIDTSISGQVPILLGLLDLWGLDTAHIVAHDIGGGIAQRLAVLHPERVESLTLIDVVSFDSYPSKRTKQQMEAGLEKLIRKHPEEHRKHFREWLSSTMYDSNKLEESLDTYLDYISGPVGQASLFQHQVRHYDSRHTMEISERLGEVGANMPVKLIWGADDAWQVVDWAHKLKEAIPGSELDIVPECGHFSLEDQPERVSELLCAFLQKHC